NLEAAMVFLDSGVVELPRQEELAKLLHQSETSSELLEKLRKIPDPIPCLALEICRAFRYEGRHREGRDLLQKLNLPIPCNDHSRRLYVQLKREFALCEIRIDPENACRMFANTIRSGIDLLGRTNEDIIQLRLNFAEFLETSSRYSGAVDVVSGLKINTKDLAHIWWKRLGLIDKRLRYQGTKKRRFERPMPAEQTLIEDDKENMHQSKPHSPCKKRKLTPEIGTEEQGERGEKTQKM
ncbi:hypothetical protein MMC25_003213, partial [Agyrium rufum]|nr:hypothetical protein [Agyrium rufum]